MGFSQSSVQEKKDMLKRGSTEPIGMESKTYSQTLKRKHHELLDQNTRICSRKIKHTERLVSLYFTLMSAAVRRMASIASSKVTLYTPSLAMESWAAVIALTAIADRIKSDLGIK
jgi:hypothetical protein